MTTQGAIVKLHGASSESCALLSISVWNSKTGLVVVRKLMLGYVAKRGWGVEGYWCLRKWVQ